MMIKIYLFKVLCIIHIIKIWNYICFSIKTIQLKGASIETKMEPQQHQEGPYATAMIPRQPSSLERPRPPERRSHSRLTQSQIGSTRPQTVSKVSTRGLWAGCYNVFNISKTKLMAKLFCFKGNTVAFYVQQTSRDPRCKISLWWRGTTRCCKPLTYEVGNMTRLICVGIFWGIQKNNSKIFIWILNEYILLISAQYPVRMQVRNLYPIIPPKRELWSKPCPRRIQ